MIYNTNVSLRGRRYAYYHHRFHYEQKLNKMKNQIVIVASMTSRIDAP